MGCKGRFSKAASCGVCEISGAGLRENRIDVARRSYRPSEVDGEHGDSRRNYGLRFARKVSALLVVGIAGHVPDSLGFAQGRKRRG
jgi:hypothetical protein